MDTPKTGALRRVVITLLLAAGLGGCVYAPPYAAYDASYPAYAYPTYVGPPIALDFGFGFYDGPRHGHYRRHHHHGWRHHGGHHRGGWGHGRGRGRGRH